MVPSYTPITQTLYYKCVKQPHLKGVWEEYAELWKSLYTLKSKGTLHNNLLYVIQLLPQECKIILKSLCTYTDFAGGSDSKETTCNEGDLGSLPGSGRSPGAGLGNPLRILAWKTPWTDKPVRLQSMRLWQSWTRLNDWHTYASIFPITFFQGYRPWMCID